MHSRLGDRRALPAGGALAGPADTRVSARGDLHGDAAHQSDESAGQKGLGHGGGPVRVTSPVLHGPGASSSGRAQFKFRLALTETRDPACRIRGS